MCVCVCVFFRFILDNIKFVGRTSRGHTGRRSHRISHPPSFCGACLHFSCMYVYVCMVITYSRVVVVVVSHIQRIGCQPEKTTLHGGQSRSWSAEQGKENKRKSLAAYPPPPTPHTARSEKINKITRRIYRRYAGGRSRVRTRIPSARRLGLWVWLRNSTLPSAIIRFPVSLLLSSPGDV